MVAPARYRATERIGLASDAGRLRHVPFGDGRGRAGRRRRARARAAATSDAAPLTTLAAAAEFVGVPLGAPPTCTRRRPSVRSRRAARRSTRRRGACSPAWFAYAARAAGRPAVAASGRWTATDVQLWPEHFDLAIELGDEAAGTRANLRRRRPGDDDIAEPYLYVGPWDADRRTGPLAAYPFGAAITYESCGASGADAAVTAFFARCSTFCRRLRVARARGAPGSLRMRMTQTFTRMDNRRPSSGPSSDARPPSTSPVSPSAHSSMLRSLAEITDGFAVDQLTHSLQTATRAERGGADPEMVFASLLHDIGKAVSVPNHPEIAAAIIKPYVRPEVYEVIRAHQDFQGRALLRGTSAATRTRAPSTRANRGSTSPREFADEWDQTAFDPDYDTLPLEHFEPLVREMFARRARSEPTVR